MSVTLTIKYDPGLDEYAVVWSDHTYVKGRGWADVKNELRTYYTDSLQDAKVTLASMVQENARLGGFDRELLHVKENKYTKGWENFA